jgi:hypothetical protein
MVILGVNYRGNDATRALKRTVPLSNSPQGHPRTSPSRAKGALESQERYSHVHLRGAPNQRWPPEAKQVLAPKLSLPKALPDESQTAVSRLGWVA